MKKIIITLMLIVSMVACLGAFVGCSNTDYTVGIIQFLQHDALDKANESFQTELTSLLKEEGKTVKFLDQNASGEVSSCATIANTLTARKCDLILAIATPAAQALKTATLDSGIPSLFTAITDPESAGLLAKNSNGENYMTGTSDLNPIAEQVALLKEIIEANGATATKIGALYMTSEDNSVFQINILKEVCKSLNIEVQAVGLSTLNEIGTAVSTLNSCQGIYIPTDNTLANAASTVHSVNKEGARLPIVCGESSMNNLCGIATYGVEYSIIGKDTAKMAFEILVNGKKPQEIPVLNPSNLPLTANQEIASELGITIPQSILDRLA